VVPAKGSPALMRAMNAAQVVRCLRAKGPQSRADLARATGLSTPTVTNVVSHLEDLGYIKRVAGAQPEGRRPAPRYAYHVGRGSVLGVDIGADKTLLLLADLDGAVLESDRFSTPDGPAKVLKELKTVSDRLLARADAPPGSLLSVVVGTPGVVSREGVVTVAPQLSGWEGLNLGVALEEIYDCPVALEGEVTLSLQAERALGVAKGINDALFVHLGIGIGAALLLGGTIHRGADGGAGEIGEMPYPYIGYDRDRRFAPLETVVSGAAFRQRGRELAAQPNGSHLLRLAGGDPDSVDASIIFAAARQKDPAARELIWTAMEALAWGLSCLICALNPRTVVIGGGMSPSADLFLPQLRDQVADAVPFAPDWSVSELGDEAVALGAINRATTLVEDNLFAPLYRRASS